MVLARRHALALVALSFGAGCVGAPAPAGPPCGHREFSYEFYNNAIDTFDVLIAIDASPSMRAIQAHVMSRLGPLVTQLVAPPDRNGDGRPDHPPPRDLHAGVVSTDLGSGGRPVAGCEGAGDDGVLDPIARGLATRAHRGHESAPPELRPRDCEPAGAAPAFLAFASDDSDPARFEHALRCTTGLYAATCPVSQPLEAVYRALVHHRADDHPDNTSPNAGFLRAHAVLSIVVIAGDDDASVRDCRYAEPNVPCRDARDVFDPVQTDWRGITLYDRLHYYRAGSAQDPTFPLDRYVDPSDPTRGFLGLTPGHPERVYFTAITGVPVAIPRDGAGDLAPINWDALLGGSGEDPDDLGARDPSSAVDDPSEPGGAITMRPGQRDPACPARVVPACRRMIDPSATPASSCDASVQYAAAPAPRLVEVARRFDEGRYCNRTACRNGSVVSLCGDEYGGAVERVSGLLSWQAFTARCFPPLHSITNTPEGRVVQCEVREVLPPQRTACDPARGERPLLDAAGAPSLDAGTSRPICVVDQVPTLPDGSPVTSGPVTQGFFYDTRLSPSNPNCAQRIAFTLRARPESEALIRVHCAETTTPACD